MGKVDLDNQSPLLEIGGDEGSEYSTFKITNSVNGQGNYEIKDISENNYLTILTEMETWPAIISSHGNPFQAVFMKLESAGNDYKGGLAMKV